MPAGVRPFRGVASYIAAAKRVGWDLAKGHLFLIVAANGGRRKLPLSAARMMAALHAHLRAAGFLSHFTMHSLRVGDSLMQSIKGTAVDGVMKIAGWKMQRVVEPYNGDQGYCESNHVPLSEVLKRKFSACGVK